MVYSPKLSIIANSHLLYFILLLHSAATTRPQSPVLFLKWDCEGETLAVMQHNCASLTLFSLSLKSLTAVDTGNKDGTFLSWSKTAPVLAVGTSKGALVLYNHATQAKWTLQGKHAGAITGGDWSADGRLALCGSEKSFTVSDAAGNTLLTVPLKHAPSALQFSAQKADAAARRSPGSAAGHGLGGGVNGASGGGAGANGGGANGLQQSDSTVSLVLSGQTILLHSSTDTTETPIELAFQPRYGEIKTFSWFGDGYVLVGFASGAVVALSSHMAEIRGEMQSLKVHGQRLNDLAFSPVLHKVASVGDDGLRILDVSNAAQWQPLAHESCAFPPSQGEPVTAVWSPDGQILTVSTVLGAVVSFLASVPLVGAANASAQHLAYVSSLRRVTVASVADPAPATGAFPPALVARLHIDVAVEPSLVALGPNQVAVGMNNFVWFYNVAQDSSSNAAADGVGALSQDVSSSSTTARRVMGQMDFQAPVTKLELTATYAAALTEDRRLVMRSLQAIAAMFNSNSNNNNSAGVTAGGAGGMMLDASAFSGPGHELMLPDVTAFSLSPTLLTYATADGVVHIFHLAEWTRLGEYRLPSTNPNPNSNINGNNGSGNHNDASTAVVVGLYPNPAGTKAVVVDSAARAHVLLASEDAWVETPAFPATADAVLWDVHADCAGTIFAVVDVAAARRVHTYALEPLVVAGAAVGPCVSLVSSTDNFPARYAPLLLRGGVLHGILAGAPTRTQAICLHSHRACYPAFNSSALRNLLGLTEFASPHLCSLALAPAPAVARVLDPAEWVAAALELAALGRIREAWAVLRGVEPAKDTVRVLTTIHAASNNSLNNNSADNAANGNSTGLAGTVPAAVANDPHVRVMLAALRTLNIDIALSIAGLLKDTARAAALSRLVGIDDCELVAGFVQLLNGDLNAAQHLFLRSSRPEEAVLMRCDAQHWPQALKLAPTCAPLLVAEASRRCAQQAEFRGDTDQALTHYRTALDEYNRRLATAAAAGLTGAEVASLRSGRLLALGGLARATARHGDVIAAVRLAHQAADRTLYRELAALLEGMRLWTDASELHVAAGDADRAVLALINAKAFAKATPLIAQVSTPKVLLAYAKAMEATKNYAEAAGAYERAHDIVAIVRLLLSANAGLNDPQRAIALVRRTRYGYDDDML